MNRIMAILVGMMFALPASADPESSWTINTSCGDVTSVEVTRINRRGEEVTRSTDDGLLASAVSRFGLDGVVAELVSRIESGFRHFANDTYSYSDSC